MSLGNCGFTFVYFYYKFQSFVVILSNAWVVPDQWESLLKFGARLFNITRVFFESFLPFEYDMIAGLFVVVFSDLDL